METGTFPKKARMLFGPLVRYRIIVFIMTLSIIVAMVLVSYELELVEQSKDDLLVLAFEFLNETGPDYVKACREHVNFMKDYIIHLEGKHLSLLKGWLYLHGSPNKLLRSIVSSLERPRDNEAAKEAIIKAGEDLLKFCGDSVKYSRASLIWSKYRKVPVKLEIGMDSALAESHEMLEKFGRVPSLENAATLCEKNRQTMLLLSLGRSGHRGRTRVASFQDMVRQSHYYYKNIADDMVSDDRSKHLFLQYADSEQRRVRILDAMLDDDMDAAEEQLWDAIDHAFKEKHGLRFQE